MAKCKKIHTANKAKVDVFFMALLNHNRKVIDIEKSFEYYPVSTFAEAVEILQNHLEK